MTLDLGPDIETAHLDRKLRKPSILIPDVYCACVIFLEIEQKKKNF